MSIVDAQIVASLMAYNLFLNTCAIENDSATFLILCLPFSFDGWKQQQDKFF